VGKINDFTAPGAAVWRDLTTTGRRNNLHCVPAADLVCSGPDYWMPETVLGRLISTCNGVRSSAFALGVAIGTVLMTGACIAAEPLAPFRVEDGQIRTPLTPEAGDAARGKSAVLSRDAGNCFLCHSVPEAGDTPLGNIGPPLAGVGRRLTAAQLRMRLVDSTRINRTSVMPAYYRTKDLRQVASVYFGKPLLTAQQVEDVIAYLLTLRN
jgi:sulfur-oxidizing protein SoxX